MPDERQACINAFATGCFRDIADGDYITARVCFRLDFFQQFHWSASQALEKYLKAILLYNNFGAKGFRHDVRKLFEAVLHIPDIDFDFPGQVGEAIDYFDHFGPNRYFEFSYFVRAEHLLQLDAAVWHIRRYCTYLRMTFPRDDGKEDSLFSWKLSQIQGDEILSEPYRFRHQSGVLEKIVDGGPSLAREQLVWQNLYYGLKSKGKLRKLRRRTVAANPTHFVWEEIYRYVKDLVDMNPQIRREMEQRLSGSPALPSGQGR